MNKFNRNHSLLVLFDEEKRIFIQDRRSISKAGEEYGFFGGGVDEGGTFEEALIRETKEELNIDLKPGEATLACNFSKTINGLGTSTNYIYVLKFNDFHKSNLIVNEGDSGEWLYFDDFRKKKNIFSGLYDNGYVEEIFGKLLNFTFQIFSL